MAVKGQADHTTVQIYKRYIHPKWLNISLRSPKSQTSNSPQFLHVKPISLVLWYIIPYSI